MDDVNLYSQIKVIQDSGLFDLAYYRTNYQNDLKGSQLDPIEHYIIFGAKMGFNPYSSFNTREYIEMNPDLAGSRINPLVHFIQNNPQNRTSSNVSSHTEVEQDDFLLVKESNEFDEIHYKTEYKEYLSNSSITPLEHYLQYGWKMGFNPSKKFNTNEYLEMHPDVAMEKLNPLVHYVKYGKKENRGTRKQQHLNESYFESHISKGQKFIKLEEVISILSSNANKKSIPALSPTPIILPVYKSLELARICIESILKNTQTAFRLVIIDDASNDPELEQYLKKVTENNRNVLLLKNEQNLGFVKSVNSALPYVKGDFALVNSDIEVPPGWLERLMYPIRASKKIASSTPFTNSGTICSFPQALVDNPLFEGLTLHAIDKKFQLLGNQRYIEIPTGVGFCMGFSKQVVDQIGFFDEKTFGKGYGEENDWCMRALRAGYKNIMVPNLFVYHKHGGSFTTREKEVLLKENLSKLHQKHPGYNKIVNDYIKDDPLDSTRALISALLISDLSKPFTLIMDHSFGGGANLYCNERIEEKIKNDETVLLLTYDLKQQIYLCLYHREMKIRFTSENITDVKLFIRMLSISEIFLNNIYLYNDPLDIISFVTTFKNSHPHVKLTLPIHDYFSICPHLELHDQNNQYCGASTDNKKCMKCLKSLNVMVDNKSRLFSETTHSKIMQHGITYWREHWGKLITCCDEILCFSDNSKKIFSKIYEFATPRVKVIPHTVTYLKKASSAPINIGVIGNINEYKGRAVIEEMIALIENNNLDINILLLGRTDKPIDSKHFRYLGTYKREELGNTLSLYNIDMFFISSVWPETFSYTTEELITLGYQIACFDLGAPAERLEKYPGGVIIPETNAESALACIIKAVKELRLKRDSSDQGSIYSSESLAAI